MFSKRDSLLPTLRSTTAKALAWLVLASAAAPALGQSYPVKPVRLIIPFAPGGPNDMAARIFSAKLAEMWGQQVIVDNRGGANTIVGAQLAAHAQPDGYTLFQASLGTLVNNPLLYRSLPYDARKSFVPISLITGFTYVIVAHPTMPANSLRELAALAKARPSQLAYGTSGTGSAGHLAGVLFETMADVKLSHVPYKGTAIGVADLIAGHIPLMFTTFGTAGAHIHSRKVKAIVVAAAKRRTDWPDIPAAAEAGYPGFEMSAWSGVVAPAATARPLIVRLHADIARVAAMPEVIDRMKASGLELLTSAAPDEFAAYIARDFARVGKAVQASGIKLD
jgi:tripartite-type tricarboxylate transporter receptor subunit TctC